MHSSAHDKRRHKRIDRLLKQERKQLEADCKQATAAPYYCRADARAAGEKLIHKSEGSYHRLEIDVQKEPKYGRGRPAAGKPRPVQRYEYRLTATLSEAADKVGPLREDAGCFVLLTNLLDQQEEWPAQELLSLYKSQIGIEKNFSFLKDPAIVNSIFLKKAERIEVLGLVLLISLLIWRLMERSMRQYVETNDCTLPGWVRRQTQKTDRVYDDDQVCIRDGRHDWPTPAAGKTVEAVSAGVFASPGRTRRGIHGSIEARKMGNRSLSGVLNVR